MVQGGSTSGSTTTLALCPLGELLDALPASTPMAVITSLCLSDDTNIIPYARYAMREALAITCRQGLEKLWSDHRACHEQLWAGLSEMGEAYAMPY
jgi:hypothetical protein